LLSKTNLYNIVYGPAYEQRKHGNPSFSCVSSVKSRSIFLVNLDLALIDRIVHGIIVYGDFMKIKDRREKEEKAKELESKILRKIKAGGYIGKEWIATGFREKDYSSVSSFLGELQGAGNGFEEEITELNNLQHCTWT